jgi:solute carrier family 35 protein E3
VRILIPLATIARHFAAAYTSISDVHFNLTGTVIASAATIITSCYQIWVGTSQQFLKVDSQQLMLYQVPVSLFMLLLVIPIQEDVTATGLLGEPWPLDKIVLVLSTGALSFLVNLSTFSIIGNTSALTYNVLGHLKSCVIICSDFVLFGAVPNIHNITGIMMTISGVFLYSHFKQIEDGVKSKSEKTDTKGR